MTGQLSGDKLVFCNTCLEESIKDTQLLSILKNPGKITNFFTNSSYEQEQMKKMKKVIKYTLLFLIKNHSEDSEDSYLLLQKICCDTPKHMKKEYIDIGIEKELKLYRHADEYYKKFENYVQIFINNIKQNNVVYKSSNKKFINNLNNINKINKSEFNKYIYSIYQKGIVTIDISDSTLIIYTKNDITPVIHNKDNSIKFLENNNNNKKLIIKVYNKESYDYDVDVDKIECMISIIYRFINFLLKDTDLNKYIIYLENEKNLDKLISIIFIGIDNVTLTSEHSVTTHIVLLRSLCNIRYILKSEEISKENFDNVKIEYIKQVKKFTNNDLNMQILLELEYVKDIDTNNSGVNFGACKSEFAKVSFQHILNSINIKDSENISKLKAFSSSYYAQDCNETIDSIINKKEYLLSEPNIMCEYFKSTYLINKDENKNSNAINYLISIRNKIIEIIMNKTDNDKKIKLALLNIHKELKKYIEKNDKKLIIELKFIDITNANINLYKV